MPKVSYVIVSRGVVTYLHSDRIANVIPGKKVAPRVSNVFFDEDNQEWVAVLKNGREIARDKSRDAVIQKENIEIMKMIASCEHVPGGIFLPPMYAGQYGISITVSSPTVSINHKGAVRDGRDLYDSYLVKSICQSESGELKQPESVLLVMVKDSTIFIKRSDEGVDSVILVESPKNYSKNISSVSDSILDEIKSRSGVNINQIWRDER